MKCEVRDPTSDEVGSMLVRYEFDVSWSSAQATRARAAPETRPVMAARVTLRRHVLSLVCGVMVAPVGVWKREEPAGSPFGCPDETPQLGGTASGWEEAELERSGSPRVTSVNSH